MIAFDNVSYRAGGRGIINGVSFRVERGSFCALIGANGAGKSTLGRLCRGLLKPDSGRVTTGGLDTSVTKASAMAAFTGFLFQNPDRQICKNSVREEIAFALAMQDIDRAEADSRCEECLAEFSLDGDAAPFAMSRGERQKVALASLAAARPELLILDEPTTGLDSRESASVMDSILRLNRAGATVFMVSHDMDLVQRYAREVMVLCGGKILDKGPVRRVLADKELLSSASLLPPQMTELASRLGRGFEEIFTAEEMADATERASRRSAAQRRKGI